MHRGSKDIEDELKFKDTGEYEVLVSRNDTDHMIFSSASSSTKPIGYNALNWVKEQVGKIQELTFSNFIESVGRWYKSDENNISDKMVAMKDSEIVLGNVSNIDDLITDTNIFSDQDALALNHVPLLSNESTIDFVSTNNAFNMNGILILANLLVRMMNPVHDTSDTHETTINNNIVDLGHAHRLAYSSYAPVIGENAEYTE